MHDYVIVGAGSAGCVLARRLSDDPAVRVCLLEAGGSDDTVFVQCPAGVAASYRGGGLEVVGLMVSELSWLPCHQQDDPPGSRWRAAWAA